MAITDEDLRNAMEQMGGRQAWPHQLGAIGEMRAARPVSSPVAGGTPAQRRLEMEQAQRQFEEQMKLQREQMAMQERLARMQAAAARAAQQKPPERDLGAEEGMSIQALVNQALGMGDAGLTHIRDTIRNNYWKFQDPEAALRSAEQMFRGQAYDIYGNPQQLGGPTLEQFKAGVEPRAVAGQQPTASVPGLGSTLAAGPLTTIGNVSRVIQENPLLPSFAPREDYITQHQQVFPDRWMDNEAGFGLFDVEPFVPAPEVVKQDERRSRLFRGIGI